MPDDDRSTDGFSPPKSQPSLSLKKRKHNAADTHCSKWLKRLRDDKQRRATETDIQSLGEALNLKAQDVLAIIQWHKSTAELVQRVNTERLSQVNDHVRRYG